MEQTQPSSRRTLFIGLAAAIGLVFLITIVAFMLSGGADNQNTRGSAEALDGRSESQKAAAQNIEDLDETIKQAAKDQAAVEAALKDGDKQIKVSNQ